MKKEIVQFLWSEVNHMFAKQSVQSPQEYLLNTAANLFTVGENYYYVIDFVDPTRFDYISPNTGDLLGVDVAIYDVEAMMHLFHPDDIEHAQRCEAYIFNFIENNISSEEILNYKFSYQLRIKIAGSYRMMLHQAVTLSTDGFGRLSKVLSVDTLIDHVTQVNKKKLSIIGMNGAPSYYAIDPTQPSHTGTNGSPLLFSLRELEIIRYFADGYTAKEIANALHLAEGTVRTHRKNCLRKSDSPNMTALVALCIREGWI